MSDHADPIARGVLDRALAASEAFRRELLRALDARLSPLWDSAPPEQLVAEVRAVLEDHVGPLARLISDAGLASWLHGAASIVRSLPPTVSRDLPAIPPESTPKWDGMKAWAPVVSGAVDDLRNRFVVTRDEFEAMSDAARAEAFTTAYTASVEAVEKIRDAVADAVEKGQTFGEFVQRLEEDVTTSAIGVGAMDNIFRTSSASAYAAGQDRILDDPVVSDLYPFAETVPIRDSRLTELCEAISESGIQGTGIYLRDDPVWQKFKPPRRWRCRCARRYLTVRDAARRGIKYAQEWLRLGEQPPNPPYVEHPPVELPEGWTPSRLSLGAWQLGGAHAPAGGVTIDGTDYPGGRFIPGDVLDAASPEEKQSVLAGRSRNQRQRDKRASREDRKSHRQKQQAADPEYRDNKRRLVSWLLGKASSKADAAKQVAARIGGRAWRALRPEEQATAARAWSLGQSIEHRLSGLVRGSQEMVREVAMRRGLPPDHVDLVARAVAAADAAASWTANWQLVHAGLHAAGAGELATTAAAKMSYYLPVASLAYLAWSSAVNPFAALEAAKAVLSRPHAAKLSAAVHEDLVAALLEAFAKTDDPDALLARLCLAIDDGDDLEAALDAAKGS